MKSAKFTARACGKTIIFRRYDGVYMKMAMGSEKWVTEILASIRAKKVTVLP